MAIARVERTVKLARGENGRGNFLAAEVHEVREITYSLEPAVWKTPNPRPALMEPVRVEPVIEQGPFKPCIRRFGLSLMIFIAIAYTVMIFFGIARYKVCPDNSLAIYTIVQGFLVVVDASSLAIMFYRAKWIKLHQVVGGLLYGVTVMLFIVGCESLGEARCTDVILYRSALVFTIPVPLPVIGCIVFCCCSG